MVETKGIVGFHFENWSKTFSCKPQLFFVPKNIEELREIVLSAKANRKKVRVVGCGHSPSDISCTNDYLVSLRYFNNVVQVDENRYLVKVEAGITLTELNDHLQRHNLALSVLGAISDVTIGGVINTATHGSGANFNVISYYVNDLEMITASGDIIKCSRNDKIDIFLSALCGLGALGIIINVTLRCEPAFLLHQHIYPSTLDEVLEDLNDHTQSSDHFRFLWFPHTNYTSVWHTSRIYNKEITKQTKLESICNWILDQGIGYYALEFCYWVSSYFPQIVPYINRFFFRILYTRNRERVDISPKLFNIECPFKQYVNEWSIPRENAPIALLALRRMIESSNNIFAHFPIEVSFVKEDDIYLSPAFGRDSCYINIITYRPYGKHISYENYWTNYEKIMRELGGRPHWPYSHSVTATDFIKMYPYFRAFALIRKRLDPLNMFINSYLERIFETFPREGM
ncbi:L-gulonolactone oxidase-like protein [Dinothrombium tinctorium]|uniref:L-gulonolactone oxidase n=1 Tax=Dinothrombium tinctorium TaxID=1965070 RepID=A0A3S3P7Z4_9ACAR|nr:L-gulonolactone oxidase-like protein [Dinothrombium tinctorium]RWS07225.1 L-gulonolactone oxidase-like protein [Dinothrombium tinctorium]